MDLKAIIEKIHVRADEPLDELVKIFGNVSLENWLQLGFGDALSRCLLEEYERRNVCFFDKERLGKYAIILNAIIPPLPNFLEDGLKYESRFLTNYSSYCTDITQVERLISIIIKPFLKICHVNIVPELFLMKAFVKVIFHTSEATLIDCNYICSDGLISIIRLHLHSWYSDKSQYFIALIIILGRKMSKDWSQRFLKRIGLSIIRFILLRNDKQMCPFIEYLQKLYDDLALEDQIEMEFPAWKKLLDACQMIHNENSTTSLRRIAESMDENSIRAIQFVQSGILYILQSILCNPTGNIQITCDIKTFLSIFLKFKSGPEDTYTWDGSLFKTLVRLVVNSVVVFLSVLKSLRDYKEIHDEGYEQAIENYEKDIIVSLNILQSLYILNSSWHQWFDIMEDTKIVKEDLFRVDLCLESEQEKGALKIPWIAKMTKICPAITDLKYKLHMFREKLPSRKSRTSFEVSSSNAFRDVAKLFGSHGHTISSHYWDFTFQGELGDGHEVTKELYSILSQELQSHKFTLWLEEPPKKSGKEAINNENDEIEKFMFLFGQIMAKVIMDGHLLDMPISNEFIQRLGPMTHSHLRKEYFDLPQKFPLLKSIFAPLLSVKRKVEIIRSDISFSKRKKCELIRNLTFDDGSSFDNLCLNFTVPGSDVELMEGGRDVLLSPHNIDLYLEKLCHHKIQIERTNEHLFATIVQGFYQVLHIRPTEFLTPAVITLR